MRLLLLAVLLCSCQITPDTMNIGYSQGMGEGSADGFESEAENQVYGINFGWFFRPRKTESEVTVVGHTLDTNRDAVPIFQTDQPPIILHDHPEDDPSTGEQIGGALKDFGETSSFTQILILIVVMAILLLAAMAGGLWFLIKRMDKNGNQSSGRQAES